MSHGEEESECVGDDAPLPADDLLPGIDALAGGVDAGRGLDALRVDHGPCPRSGRLARVEGPNELGSEGDDVTHRIRSGRSAVVAGTATAVPSPAAHPGSARAGATARPLREPDRRSER
ncbi:hypothetical protein KPATCC21470_7988 [Kitasatospora purpeofusca]